MRMYLFFLLGIQYVLATSSFPAQNPAVVWYAPFLSGGGYCSEAHAYVLGLDERMQSKFDLTLTPVHDDTSSAIPEFDLLMIQHGDSVNGKFVRDLPTAAHNLLQSHWVEERDIDRRLRRRPSVVAICHSEPGAWHPAKYRTSKCPPSQADYAIGRTMFETDRLPDGWSDRMNEMDELWVPTKFQAKVFEDGGVEPSKIIVLPESVDVSFFDPSNVRQPFPLSNYVSSISKDTTVFLSIFKWEERKGWRILLQSYLQTFTKDENVLLVVLTNGYHSEAKSEHDFTTFMDKFARETMDKALDELPKILVLPPHLPQSDMPALYKAASAFVLPSKGEGWGRPHVEAMAMELPIIATYWSGPTEYMTEDNSYPLRIDGLSEIGEGAFRGHQWAEPSIAHLMELMQRIKDYPDEARERGKQARQDMIKHYAPDPIARTVFDHLGRILDHIEEQKRDEL